MSSEADTPRRHVIAFIMLSWGHVKSACSLLGKAVRYKSVYATIFIGSIMAERTAKELDVQFFQVSIITYVGSFVIALETGPSLFESTQTNESFMNEYKKLVNNENTCGSEPGAPQLVILDFYMYQNLQDIRAVTGQSVPIYALQAASAAAVLFLFGPKTFGGRLSNLVEDIKAIPHTDRTAFIEEVDRLFTKVDGTLINVPGIPPMYDHEHSPQKPIVPKGLGMLLAGAHNFLKECDGAVMNTFSLFEGPSIKAFEEWFSGRPVITAGPFDHPLIKRQGPVAHNATVVSAFLDSALENHGENSVIYVSFGSAFFLGEPEKLWATFDVLIEQNVPFIFAHPSPFFAVPDEIKEKIKSSGLYFTSNWIPQTTVLNHKACGWILSHAGHNSVMEALSAGVPLICWPIDSDQPTNAVNIASVHNLGYELFEVRCGNGLLPIHRLGDKTPEGTIEAVKREVLETLRKIKGEDGATKRANAKRFQDEIANLWAPRGQNWQEIKRITDILH